MKRVDYFYMFLKNIHVIRENNTMNRNCVK